MTAWLRAAANSPTIGVDREARALRGFVVAQEGPFKTAGRGEFDVRSLKKIVALMNKEPKGLKSRLAHPTLSDDGIGKYLGRVRSPRLDSVRVRRGDETVLLHAVRGDLHLDPTSFDTPNGNLGDYVLNLAESDPEAFSSSLVLQADREERLDPKTKQPLMNDRGEPLPPLWRPTQLHASDVVDTGEAVDAILSGPSPILVDGMPDEIVRRVSQYLDAFFAGEEAAVVRDRMLAFVDRYIEHAFGQQGSGLSADPEPLAAPEIQSFSDTLEYWRRKLSLMESGLSP